MLKKLYQIKKQLNYKINSTIKKENGNLMIPKKKSTKSLMKLNLSKENQPTKKTLKKELNLKNKQLNQKPSKKLQNASKKKKTVGKLKKRKIKKITKKILTLPPEQLSIKKSKTLNKDQETFLNGKKIQTKPEKTLKESDLKKPKPLKIQLYNKKKKTKNKN